MCFWPLQLQDVKQKIMDSLGSEANAKSNQILEVAKNRIMKKLNEVCILKCELRINTVFIPICLNIYVAIPLYLY